MDADLRTLNKMHAVPGHVSFSAGPNELVTAVVANAHAAAAITLLGAHVMSYHKHGDPEMLWENPNAAHSAPAAIRGGVPFCWPWFAGHPTDPRNKPHHGFVRTMPWQLAGARACPDGATELRMVVRDTSATREIWPYAFELEAVITVGQTLTIEWIASNPGKEEFSYTGALHPYFRISDIDTVRIHGLEKTDYLDKTDEYRRKTQAGVLEIEKETDAIFLDTTSEIVIQDPGFQRSIHIAKEGSRTTVVWNPGEKDRRMPDMSAGQHHNFVCVEPANAAGDVVKVPPGGEERLAMIIWNEQGAAS